MDAVEAVGPPELGLARVADNLEKGGFLNLPDAPQRVIPPPHLHEGRGAERLTERARIGRYDHVLGVTRVPGSRRRAVGDGHDGVGEESSRRRQGERAEEE